MKTTRTLQEHIDAKLDMRMSAHEAIKEAYKAYAQQQRMNTITEIEPTIKSTAADDYRWACSAFPESVIEVRCSYCDTAYAYTKAYEIAGIQDMLTDDDYTAAIEYARKMGCGA